MKSFTYFRAFEKMPKYRERVQEMIQQLNKEHALVLSIVSEHADKGESGAHWVLSSESLQIEPDIERLVREMGETGMYTRRVVAHVRNTQRIAGISTGHTMAIGINFMPDQMRSSSKTIWQLGSLFLLALFLLALLQKVLFLQSGPLAPTTHTNNIPSNDDNHSPICTQFTC